MSFQISRSTGISIATAFYNKHVEQNMSRDSAFSLGITRFNHWL